MRRSLTDCSTGRRGISFGAHAGIAIRNVSASPIQMRRSLSVTQITDSHSQPYCGLCSVNL